MEAALLNGVAPGHAGRAKKTDAATSNNKRITRIIRGTPPLRTACSQPLTLADHQLKLNVGTWDRAKCDWNNPPASQPRVFPAVFATLIGCGSWQSRAGFRVPRPLARGSDP